MQTLPVVEHLLKEKNVMVEAAMGCLGCQLY